MGTRANIKIEPMNVIWGDNVMQVQTVALIADAAGSMNNKYFFFYDSAGAKHYVWFDINSAGADPAPSGGGTAHEVDGATGASAAALATAAAAVIGAVSGFDAVASGATITITHTVAGYAQPAHNGNVPAGIAFAVTTYGDTEADAGYIEGSIGYTPNQNKAPVTSHQTGSTEISEIITGGNPEVTLTLKETTLAQLRKVFLHLSEGYTPAGANTTQVFGMGSDKQFTQTFGQAKKLRLHPVRLAAADKSEDRTFWKAHPELDEIAHSGEEVLNIPLTFKIYPDFTKPSAVNQMCIGDYSQLES